MPRRWRIPVEYPLAAGHQPRPGRRARARRRSARRPAFATTPGRRQDPQVLGAREVRVEDRRGDHRPDSLAGDPGPADGLACDRHRPGIGANEADEDPQRRRLACSVRPEQADDVPLLDRKVEAVEGGHAPVALAQAGRLDDQAHPAAAFGTDRVVSTAVWPGMAHAPGGRRAGSMLPKPSRWRLAAMRSYLKIEGSRAPATQ